METKKRTNKLLHIRKLDEELGSNTSILADLQGPKLRIGELEGDEINLEEGAELRIKVGAESIY